MNMEPKNIYMKLLSIQTEIESFHKNKQAGQGSYSYNYVDGDQVLNVIRPLMILNKVILKQEVISCENTLVDYNTKSGSKKETLSSVKMRFTWVCCETGEKDVNEFHANGMNDFEKGLGSALTYGERYFLIKYFHVPTDSVDPDNLPNRGQEKTTHAKKEHPENNLPWLNEGSEDYNKVSERLKTSGTIEDVKKLYKVSNTTSLKLDLIIKNRK